jgi:predicted transcriptional regulator
MPYHKAVETYSMWINVTDNHRIKMSYSFDKFEVSRVTDRYTELKICDHKTIAEVCHTSTYKMKYYGPEIGDQLMGIKITFEHLN